MNHVLYFDDTREDRERFARRLTDDDLTVSAVAPPPDLNLAILNERDWDLFLVDYLLMGGEAGTPMANYRGGTLAVALKERSPDHPVVLITRRGLEEWQTDRRLIETIAVFDDVVFKGDAEGSPEQLRHQLKGIAEGFGILRAEGDDWAAAIRCLGASGDVEDGLLREAAPPLANGTWEVAELARWIQAVLLRYPGVLYDDLHAASSIGISVDSIIDDRLLPLLEGATYEGAFSTLSRKWWKDRLLSWATETVAAAGLPGPVFESLREAVRVLHGIDLDPSVCTHCQEIPADSVCFIRREPVLTAHSLAYFPDSRPATMDTARVSFRAIRDSNDLDEELIDPNSLDLVKAIQDGSHY